MNNKKQIRLTVDKNGRPIAHVWSAPAMRYIKVSLEQAKIEIATGLATEIYKGGQ